MSKFRKMTIAAYVLVSPLVVCGCSEEVKTPDVAEQFQQLSPSEKEMAAQGSMRQNAVDQMLGIPGAAPQQQTPQQQTQQQQQQQQQPQ